MADRDSLELFPDEASAAPGPDDEAGGGRTGSDRHAPLPDRMRPRELDDVVGQDHLVGAGAPLRQMIEAGRLPSIVLWGPPGIGKTTLARLVATAQPAGASRFVALSAVMAGLKDVREVVAEAKRARRTGQRTVFFLDEIHRFNKRPARRAPPRRREPALIILIGATTENPSFEVIGPLLSRCRVFTLNPLSADDIGLLLRRAADDAERGLAPLAVDDEAIAAIAEAADGDARRALGMLETAAAAHDAQQESLGVESVRETIGQRTLLYDRDREEHYNTISAFIKSLRASDPDAAVYYLARMLEGGEDPLFIARRLVIFASEDVGNAEPQGLPLALAAYQAVERIGLPEGRIPLAQATAFLASAPKSNRAYVSLNRATEAVRSSGALPIPMHLRNAPTGLMKAEGYGAGYRYPHDETDAFVDAVNLPDGTPGAPFYEPSDHGAEAAIRERVEAWRKRRGSPD